MSGLHKFSFKNCCVLSALIVFCTILTYRAKAKAETISKPDRSLSANVREKKQPLFFSSSQDTVPAPSLRKRLQRQPAITTRDTTPSLSDADTLPRRGDIDSGQVAQRIDTINLKISKDTLDAPVQYEAEDSAVLLVKDNKFILYGKTQTQYKDVVINAPTTIVDQQTNVLTALGKKDSAGNIITRATFKQGSSNFESESFEYNFKSQKGITKNTYTKEGEMFIKANVSKKIDPNTVYIKGGYFTTCDYDDPHFAFKANKLKVISNKIAVSGPTHPEFEGIPIPIYLPFGIYPLSTGRHSGLLAPQFTNNQQFGLGLEGLGYYHVLNDYVDVTVRTNIYSYGGWNLSVTPSYRKRYHYNGSFNLSINHTKFAFKGDPDYSLVKTFQVNWSHSVDSRATPGTTFSASVNAGSTRYNQYIPNNPYRNFQNQMYSSIAYSRQWQGTPFSLQLSANHNQNNTSRLINVILPDAGFTMATQYPFQRKQMVGTPKWYEKIGIGYNMVARNQVSFYDTGHVSMSKIIDTLQWGAQHRFPISLQLPPMGPFFVSPSISYEETWYTHRFTRRWNENEEKVDTVTAQKGFYRDQQMSFGLGLNTNIYGMFNFGKNSYIRAIRHVIRPTIGFSYKPNLSKRNYDYVQVNKNGTKLLLPQFEGNLFPAYSYGRFGGLTFSLDNNFEMKVKGKKDTVERKVKLIDGLTFSSGYNFLDTAFKLQPIAMSFRTTLFEKLSISANGQIDPYKIDPATGLRQNRFVWEGSRFTLGRFTGGSVSASTSFQSKPKDGKDGKNGNQVSQVPGQTTITDPRLLTDQAMLSDYMRNNPAEFVDFSINWSINLSYSLSLTRRLKTDYSGFTTETYSSISFNNSFNLTPKWNFSTQGFYDFNTHQITMFTMNIARDMHCWQMAIGITPIGNYKYYNISLSPKSGILRDLRINRTKYFYNY
jgi:hypothetical protein